MKYWFSFLLLTAFPELSFGLVIPPALGSAANFSVFTAVGAFDNVGPTIVYGDIGTNVGAFSGFPLGVVFGNIRIGDAFATQAATDVQVAYGQASNIPCAVPLAFLGGGQLLTPNSYCLGGQTTFAGELILDAQNDPNAIFFIRVSGAMTTGAGSTVTLINGANRNNVYWQVGGRVDLGSNSLFQGTLIVDGAINMIEGARLQGRALSREGAITMDTNLVNVPEATATNWLGSAVGTLANRQNWFLSSNWSNGVPTALLNATIFSGRPSYPVIPAGTPTALNLILSSMASLTQNGGTLELHGDFTNNGTFTAGGGTVALVGTLNQRVGGASISRFWNLTVGMPGATLTGRAQLRRVLTLNGNLTTSNNPLTLLSDAAGTGMVANSGGVVNGRTTVQRYLTNSVSSAVGYRHLSSPVVSTSVADLTTGGFTPRVNPAYNAIPSPYMTAAQFPNVFGFDEQRGGASNQNFIVGYFSPNSIEDPLVSGNGYSVNLAGGLTPDFVGTLQNGDLTMNGLTRTGNGGKAGWKLLGNPYPAPLDWDLVPVPLGMSNAISVFKNTGVGQAGVYLTRVSDGLGNGTGTLTDGYVAMAQGFFARVTGPGPVNFTFPQAARVTTYANPLHFRGAPDTRPLVKLTLRQQGQTQPDAQGVAQVYFTANATTGTDAFDGASPAHNVDVPTLLTLAGTDELTVNGLPETSLTNGTTIPLLLDLPTAGTYELAVAQLLNLAGKDVALLDRLTGTRYVLSQQPTVAFTAVKAGESRDRFVLTIGQRVTGLTEAATAAGFEVYPNPLKGTDQLTIVLPGVEAGQNVSAVMYNQLGQTVWTNTLRSGAGGVRQDVTTRLPRGIYTLQLMLPGGTKQSSRVVVN